MRIKDNKQDPWITHEMTQDKIRFQKLALPSKNIVDIARARAARTEIKAIIKHARSNYIKDGLEIHRHDPQKRWKQINNLIPDNENAKDINLVNEIDNLEIKNKTNVADFMNNCFTDIGPTLQLAAIINTPWAYDGIHIQDQIPDLVTTPAEVLDLCNNIEKHKSSSISLLSTRLLNDSCAVLSYQLAFKIFTTATIPNSWNVAKVKPLYKGGDRTNVSNHRPISILPLPGNIVEKIIHNRLTNLMETHDILTIYQDGFRKSQKHLIR